jgi:nucleoside-specific outer membrane channel protein Tsx
MLKHLGFVFIGIIFCAGLHAASISVLKGNNFTEDQGYRGSRTTLTIENFSVWDYGTVFFYYDITEPTGDDSGPDYYSNQFFGGLAPTLSLSKITGANLNFGIVRDISLRAEIENGSALGFANFQNYFYGLQYDLSVPGFDFLSVNTVLRDNPDVAGVGFQIGLFWQMTYEFLEKNRLKFTGFLATSPWDGNNNNKNVPPLDSKGRFLITQPQLLYDLGHLLRNKKDTLEIGMEYSYALNRFQFSHKDEKVLQGMVKMSF